MIATQGRKAKKFDTPEERIAYDRARLKNYYLNYVQKYPGKVQETRKACDKKRGYRKTRYILGKGTNATTRTGYRNTTDSAN